MSRPRIRSLKPECWEDEALGHVSRDARLLFVGLITQADDQGRLKAAVPLLRSQVFPYDHELDLSLISEWLGELETVGLISLYSRNERSYAALSGWEKNQKVDHAKDSEIPPPPKRGSSRSRAKPRESSRETGGASRGPARLARGRGSGSDRDQDRIITSDPAGPDSPTAEERENDPDIEALCSLLADLLEGNGSKRPTPAQVKGWRRDVRLMVEQDGRTLEQIEAAVRWSQQDSFWRANVLSMGKLREKWDQMRLQAQRGGGSKAEGNLTVLRSLQEGAA